jgi:hypothetical protein
MDSLLVSYSSIMWVSAPGGVAAMYFKRLNSFIERHIAIIGSVLVIGALALWILAQFIPRLGDWIITNGLFSVILIALVVDLLNRVIELKGSPTLQAFDSQDDAMPAVERFVEEESPKTADLLEYSTSTIRPLLGKLRRANSKIRLLVFNPEFAISKEQKQTIETYLTTIRRDFREYQNLHVCLYRTPASLRGRSLGEKLVNVGWYTYQHDGDELLLDGHTNAMVLATTDTPQGRSLQAMFARTFAALWDDPTTVKLSEAPVGKAPLETHRAEQ